MQLGRNAWTVQSRKSSNSSQRMSIGGNKRRTRANTLPLVFPQARRKDGSSWAPYIGSARRSTTASSSNSAGGTTRRTAKLASKQSADAARDKCQRSQQHYHRRGPPDDTEIHRKRKLLHDGGVRGHDHQHNHQRNRHHAVDRRGP